MKKSTFFKKKSIVLSAIVLILSSNPFDSFAEYATPGNATNIEMEF